MIITIARQYGCGALAIGKMLGAAYGIPFYTRKGLLEMARAEGVLEEMDDFFEERPVDELLFAISIGQRNCIIIGRCGNYIFRRRADLVSVFLKGREDERVRAVVAEQGIGMAEAREIVRDMDDSRVRYHRYYTHLQWGNSSDYDLCFDSVRLGAERSVALIRQYIEGIGIK